MKKPDPNRSRVRDIAKELIALSQRIEGMDDLKHVGPLVFDADDIYATDWELDIMLRKIFYFNHITEAYFNERYRLYGLRTLGKHPNQVTNDRSNTLRSLKQGYITGRKFVEVIKNVLNLNISNMICELKLPDNTTQTIDTASGIGLPPNNGEVIKSPVPANNNGEIPPHD